MTLGWSPIDETIELTNGDWIFERTNEAGAIPPDTVIEIKWANGVTWPGEIHGATVRWRVESTACTAALIPDGTAFEIFVRYPNDATSTTDDYVWMGGRALRTDFTRQNF
ncbi:LtfC-like domain-containing protein [Prescottella equi]|uniref:LtfC-like domain-containing protein n=1 Tax=Rhodococcus hoagii TaxID=43767 RepID=UPI0007CD91AC|nr:hypothetical protein [Prescottella equi]ORL01577.1 hypothetical protein A6F56_04460 [Prescottella equi]